MRSQGRTGIRRLAVLAVFAAFAMILSYVEILIPFSFGIPGIKLGLPNLMTVLILYIGSDRSSSVRLADAAIVLIIRIVTVSLLFTDVYAMLYSLCGGFISLLCMWLLSRSDRVSPVGCSICGGIMHNAGQLLVAVAIVSQLKLVYYLPVLLLAGTITGFLTGILSGLILNRRGVQESYDRFFEG